MTLYKVKDFINHTLCLQTSLYDIMCRSIGKHIQKKYTANINIT